ncbi:CobL [Desulforapulum autotrophicum HRM2]|uniref:CobL n=1 Tax=Desulforapulum autotrophicum (strain ATCC 43914 / DSM 3382 / VKM B-1955 / HRM2) TaxID=177437 RepID=C0QFF5_DESAH|nr:bifunctional cobalt-precorrin-7 (C(5))-methyltransferase/cobalt-precorrin-6B (C(15))-methyltransferase [Desulforapulum autotrophicum]ACN13351.1 CobL [Desulforapulum autotrophicum HRM2]
MMGVEIIGMGLSEHDLTSYHRQIIEKADLLVGGRRHLEIFHSLNKASLTITGKIDNVVTAIKQRMADERIVVLASGDPLFFGIGSTLVQALGQASVTIYPNISSLGAAFSAIKEPWHDALLISLHGREPRDLMAMFTTCNKIGILTDHTRTPGWIADRLIENNLTGFRLCVLERLGSTDQTISWHEDMAAVANIEFAMPNVVILKGKKEPCHGRPKQSSCPLLWPGMPDTMFVHERGLITKSEVRSISISKLRLWAKDHVVWDLGAGSGSVGIEAALFVPRGKVVAVEKNASRISDIRANRQQFQANNLSVVQGNTLDVMVDLPDPDRIFIGGGGQDLLKIVEQAGRRLKSKGVMVVNTVLIQHTTPVLDLLRQMGFAAELVQIQVSKSKPMPVGERLAALNPVWIISGEKTKGNHQP